MSTPSPFQTFDCVVLVGSNFKLTGLWKVEDCSITQGFICKRTVGEKLSSNMKQKEFSLSFSLFRSFFFYSILVAL